MTEPSYFIIQLTIVSLQPSVNRFIIVLQFLLFTILTFV